jgi:inorganic triphosphatase YgiF
MSMEIEAKFIVPGLAIADRIRALSLLGGYSLRPGHLQVIHDAYLDTPRRSLLSAGYACRRREGNGVVLVTLKGVTGVSGAVHRREELEVELARDTPPAAWPPSPARDKVLELAGGQPLEPLFRLGQERFVREVVDGDRRVAVSSLDSVSLVMDGRSRQWRELEIELAPAGTEEDLSVLSGWVIAKLGLRPAAESKFERALKTLDGEQS